MALIYKKRKGGGNARKLHSRRRDFLHRSQEDTHCSTLYERRNTSLCEKKKTTSKKKKLVVIERKREKSPAQVIDLIMSKKWSGASGPLHSHWEKKRGNPDLSEPKYRRKNKNADSR